MNQEVKKLWIEALRSGEYKQATGQLRCDDGFCCLGVLSDLYKKDHSDCDWGGGSYSYFVIYREIGATSSSTNLVDEVVRWAELDSADPQYECGETLSDLNDMGASFNEIADVIEKHL